MRKILVLLLAGPLFSAAQRPGYEKAFFNSIPDSLSYPVHMPKRDYNPFFRPEDSGSYSQKSRILIIQSDSVYKKQFRRYIYNNDSLKQYRSRHGEDRQYRWMQEHHIDSLPVIDFTKQELILYSACSQCFAVCRHSTGLQFCHRNACYFREAWFIREKFPPVLVSASREAN